MNFYEAIASCFSKYADFNGRATRSEYWWFFLFITLASCGAVIIDTTLYYLFSIGTLLPLLAVGARRLHDTNSQRLVAATQSRTVRCHRRHHLPGTKQQARDQRGAKRRAIGR